MAGVGSTWARAVKCIWILCFGCYSVWNVRKDNPLQKHGKDDSTEKQNKNLLA